jgi:prophage DNA circulation protein
MSVQQVESIINAKLESFATSIEAVAEMMKIIADSNNTLTNEIATLKGEFETFKSAPTNNTNEGEKFAKVGNLTAKQLWLKNNKNK